MTFTFRTAGEIRFGRGVAAEAAPWAVARGRRVCVVGGASAGRSDGLAAALEALGCEVVRLSVPREPDVALVEDGVRRARGAEVVLALGGGSAIDAGKALAALLPAPGGAMRHLEVVGEGRPLDADPLPFAAIPTTAGTGAEVTKNAVIAVPQMRRKVSLRDDRMLADLALVDPSLTDGCPKPVTLASGLDAVCQVIEPYLSARANPLTDALCRAAIPAGLQALARLMEVEDADARDRMAWVSLCGGMALANAGLGVVHGLAGPLGGVSGAPHGAICGALLPHGLAANRAAGAVPERIAEVEAWSRAALGGDIGDWARRHGLPRLGEMGLSRDDIRDVAEAAAGSSSMRGNPVALEAGVLVGILEAAW
ncbi:iron-containing alcohol dehydrogenase [Palleronia rufa]|uniref:iron-containing alcohol dehydrogenase n=2 Tax=Palleronia rufa TaxID=1530186 RepID=UPI0005643EC1|nr:iron-containing alcohol dehydrogenase [Palleronia rufa]